MIHPKDLEPFFDFEPGSRIGVAKGRYLTPFGSHAWFLQGEQCEVTENDVINISDPSRNLSAIPEAWAELVHEAGELVSSTEPAPRSKRRATKRPSTSDEGSIESLGKAYEDWVNEWVRQRMQRNAQAQAVLMDKLQKEKETAR